MHLVHHARGAKVAQRAVMRSTPHATGTVYVWGNDAVNRGVDVAGSDITLVTGATGFVGSAVARALAREGHKLRLLVRAGSDRRNLYGLGDAELVEGNLAKPSTLPKAVMGCRYVFHVAADYRLWVPNPLTMRKVNVEGTVALFKIAQACGVERCIYTSSVAALGLHPDGKPATEYTFVDEKHLIGAYKRSKYDAQEAVRALVLGGQLQLLLELLVELHRRLVDLDVVGDPDPVGAVVPEGPRPVAVSGVAAARAHEVAAAVTPSPLAMLMLRASFPPRRWPSRMTNGRVKK